ncbi:cytochrome P450 3A2-like [Oppia nitens]|uniref:cytochrome P450 3A2-like n=1 Tax=Oppia nitens TaxID=1686743 RepID=UPI0023DC002B|nr:cytochrome P450 3A2-like [Oppia nitens]
MSILMTSIITDYLSPIQWIVLTLITIVSVLTYYHFKWKRLLSYWSARNIDGPKPLSIFGNLLDKYSTAKPLLELQWYRQFGRLYGTYTGPLHDLTIADPELIKQILVKDFHRFRNRRDVRISEQSSREPMMNHMFSARDDTWKRLRAIASPTFTSGRLRKLFGLIGECCDDFVDHLDGLAERREPIDAKKVMGHLTMDVIGRCAFATKPNTYTDPDDQFTRSANSLFYIPLWRIVLLIVLPAKLMSQPFFWRRLLRLGGVDFFINLSRKLMAHRRQTNTKYNDFLQLLMDAEHNNNDSVEHREASDANEAHHVNEGDDELRANREALSNVSAKRLTEDEILGQCFLFFIAGYETSATTLSYCMYELALNPEFQERLFEEINCAVGKNGKIDYELLSSLPFLDSLISETLRKYPPALRLEREAQENIDLGDTGIQLEKGALCEIPIYAIHHDPEYYPEPDRFNPDRFMPENRHLLRPYTYLPFGVGPRNCIGMRFALLEGKLALAKLSQRFRFKRVPETDVPVVFNIGEDGIRARRLLVPKGSHEGKHSAFPHIAVSRRGGSRDHVTPPNLT